MITMKEMRETLYETLYETEQHKNSRDNRNSANGTTYRENFYGTETTERITYGYNGKTGKPEK